MAGKRRSLDAAPLIELVEQRRHRTDGKRLVITQQGTQRHWKAYDRARRTGTITFAAADLLAIELLKMHPAEIWGPDLWNTK